MLNQLYYHLRDRGLIIDHDLIPGDFLGRTAKAAEAAGFEVDKVEMIPREMDVDRADLNVPADEINGGEPFNTVRWWNGHYT